MAAECLLVDVLLLRSAVGRRSGEGSYFITLAFSVVSRVFGCAIVASLKSSECPKPSDSGFYTIALKAKIGHTTMLSK